MGKPGIICAATAAFGLTVGVPAKAEPIKMATGNGLLAQCQESADDLTCLGYIEGAAHMAAVLGVAFCPPDGVTNGQVRDVAIGYILKHPESRHLLSTRLALIAWKKAFPCATQK